MKELVPIELWKDIHGYIGEYQISDKGRVKSLQRRCKHNVNTRIVKERILKPGLNHKGYEMVTLSKDKIRKTYRVHRLVAEAFLKESKKEFVNHIDGNKRNNNISNLEWVTPKENSQHAIKIGLIKNFRMTKEEVEDLYINKDLTISEIARLKNANVSSVSREIKKHGYKIQIKPRFDVNPKLLKCWVEENVDIGTIMKKDLHIKLNENIKKNWRLK